MTLSSNAQDSLKLENFLNGDFIEYPVKIELEQDHFYEDINYPNDHISTYNQIIELIFTPDSKIGFNSNVIPALQDLKDGKYVMYYSDFNYKKNEISSFLTKQVACIFEIKNNQLNGMSYWFSPIDQKLYKKGLYIDKNREGEWTLFYEFLFKEDYHPYPNRKKSKKNENPEIKVTINHSCSYQKGFKHGLELKWNNYVSEKIQFINGKKEGRYEFKNCDSIQISGQYKNNEKIGEWRYYKPIFNKDSLGVQKMELIERFVVNDEKIPITENIEWGYFNISNGIGINGIVDGVFESNGFETKIFPSETSDGHFINDFISHKVYDSSNKYYYKFLEFEKYYDDGQLYCKYKLKNGNLEKNNFTIYNQDGKIICLLDYTSDSIYRIKKQYDYCGKLYLSYYDKNGYVEVLYKKIGDVNYIISNDYYYFIDTNYNYPIQPLDTFKILLEQDLEIKNECIIQYKTYSPSNRTGQYFETIYPSKFYNSGEFQFDSTFQTTNFNKITQLGPFTFNFHTIDSLTKNPNFKYCKLNKSDSIIKKDLIYLGFNIDSLGKTICKLNNQLFSGTIQFIFSDTIDFKIENNKHIYKFYIKSSFQNLQSIKNLFPSFSNEFVWDLNLGGKYNYCNSQSSIKLSLIKIPFVNGQINGKVLLKSSKNEVIRSLEVKNNLLNGFAKYNSYDSNNKKYLSHKSRYVNNHLNGWSKYYDYRGKIIKKIKYPILKDNFTGTKKWKDEFEGAYKYSQEFKNGVRQGKYERSNKLKDIKLLANYDNDILNGNYYVYDRNQLVCKGTFNIGLLIDTLFIFDTLGQIENLYIYEENKFKKQINFVNTFKNFELYNLDSINVLGYPTEYYNSTELYNRNNPIIVKNNKSIYLGNYSFDRLNGFYVKFDINGNLNYTGNYKNGIKVSNWNYYDTINGNYNIRYFDSIIKVNDTLSFKTKGLFVQKNRENEIIFKKYLLDQNSLYVCTLNENFDINTFYTFFEKDTSLHGVNGYQKQYYLNGVLQCEGENRNGLPTGLWKFYNDNGSLREIGYFNNGKKQGRWLAGDLSRIHYIGDICLDFDNPKMKSYIEKLNEKLEVWVYYFQNGEQLSEEFFEFKK